MASLARDARYALRMLAKSPAFSAVAVLTLALGIGANTAIFSVTEALLLRPLPFDRPEQLALISADKNGAAITLGPLSWTRFEQLRAESRSFSGIAGFTNETFNLTGLGDPEQLTAARVSWNFFQVLGIRTALGRTFTQSEDTPSGDLVVLLSDGFWRRRFAGDRGVLGRRLTLDQKDYTVIGVLPPHFRFDPLGPALDLVTTRPDALNILTPQQLHGGASFLNAVARLRPGIRLEQAQAEMKTLAAQYTREYPGFPDAGPEMVVQAANLRDDIVANFRPAVLILFDAVALVLLIACANIASLLLARALGRRRETAVRAALGASRPALLRQYLTESLILSLAGGAVGALAGSWGTRLLVTLAGDNLPRASEIGIDAGVLGFTLALSILAAILFGLAPALQIARADLNVVLRAEGRGATSGRRRNRLLQVLITCQVALSTVLLIGAGLLVRNFEQLRNSSPGFDAHNLLTMNISLPATRYSTRTQMIAFFDEVLQCVRALPGVRAAGMTSALPANPVRFSPALVEGQPQVPLAERPNFAIEMFTPGYVEALRVPLRRGRTINEHDGPRDARVALVNEALVRRYWPHENPIGKHIWLGRQANPVEVVGVLGDVHNVGLAADAQPAIAVPFAQLPWQFMNLVVRTDGDPHRYVAAVRARIFATDRDQPVTAVRTMDEVLSRAAAQPRFTTALLAALAGTALLLALVGIYGVISYSVAERTAEMGVRFAVGARPADILRLVLRQALGVTVLGMAIGLGGALALTRLLASQLYHVSTTDPLTFASAAVLFLAVALAASYLPARRAARVDPIVALRDAG